MKEPYNGGNSYIFMSYSSKDREIAERIVDSLSGRDFNLWYDEGIKGFEYYAEIATKIRNCSLFVCLMSHNFEKSHQCTRELTFAVNHEIPVLAVFIEDFELSNLGMEMVLSTGGRIYMNRSSSYDEFIDLISSFHLVEICKD